MAYPLMPLLPRQSAKLISELSKDVKISKTGVKIVADMITEACQVEGYRIDQWKKHELHPKIVDSTAVDWIFLVDTLNFSFWGEAANHYEVKYNGKNHSGYFSLCAVVNRALEEGYPIVSSEFCSNVSLNVLKHIFRSENGTTIPLLEERCRILNETGKCLIEKFNGSFTNVIKTCENSAEKLLCLIVNNFPSYKDEAVIEGHKVSFYKRAQILIADLYACFEGKDYGCFNDIDFLTMFADYRVPQVLAYFGVLEYSLDLTDVLREDTMLKNGDRYEVEIRGCSIQAVEMICELIKEQSPGTSINAILADYYLWDYRRSHAEDMDKIFFHKTRCIYY